MTDRFTTAIEAKKAIVSLLQAQPALSDVQVTHGNPLGAIQKDCVFLYDVTWVTERWANAVKTKREERYQISCMVSAIKIGGTQEEASDRAYELFQAVETALAGPAVPATLAALGIYDVEIRPRSERQGVWESNGRLSVIEVGLEMTARK
jgi:hypothetical protein